MIGVGFLHEQDGLARLHGAAEFTKAVDTLEVVRALPPSACIRLAREKDNHNVGAVHEELEVIDGM